GIHISKLEMPTYRQRATGTVKVDSRGEINCTACNEYKCDSTSKKILVKDPEPLKFPSPLTNGSFVSYDLNSNIELHCPASGIPEPVIIWMKDNFTLRSDDRKIFTFDQGRELRIVNATRKDSGKYKCIANNGHGQEHIYFDITVGNTSDVWLASAIILGLLLVTLYLHLFMGDCRRLSKNEVLLKFDKGAIDSVNPELTLADQADLLPYDKSWEFPRHRLKLGRMLGRGAFGIVREAYARGIANHKGVRKVAVKMVHRDAEPVHLRALASELKVMVHLGKHLNVVNLLGACTRNIDRRELIVIVEYCHFGNLRDYLLRNRQNFIDQMVAETGKLLPQESTSTLYKTPYIDGDEKIERFDEHNKKIDLRSNSNDQSSCEVSSVDTNTRSMSKKDFLSWAFQVARGMDYLSQRKVLHGDLAARNILLSANNVVKICDFGLSRTMYKYDNYKKKTDGPVPIKWMAIESIKENFFSTQSDVWSFGIVLWEFFTLGDSPYPGIQAYDLLQKLTQGHRMEQPKWAPDNVYEIMLHCWNADPMLRPSFAQLATSVGKLLEKNVEMYYIELNQPYAEMNEAREENKTDFLKMMSAPDHASRFSNYKEYMNSAYLVYTSTKSFDESERNIKLPLTTPVETSSSSKSADVTTDRVEEMPMCDIRSLSSDEDFETSPEQ
ncbi:hypothetical protein QAD02_005307, partial [Eretmocerus hayati]